MVYLPAKEALRSINSPATLVRHMAWQPGEGEVLACATSKGGRILDMEQSETEVVDFGTDRHMSYLTWSPAGDLLATMGPMGGNVIIWNSNGIRLAALEHPTNYLWPPMKFNGSGKLLVVAYNSGHHNGFNEFDNGLNVFDVLTGHCLQFVEANVYPLPVDCPIVWKNELEFFFPTGTTIVEWRFGQEGPLQILTGHEARFPHPMAELMAITSLAFNSRSGLLASGGQDATVRVWNSDEASTSLATLTGHNKFVREVIWHPRNSGVLASVDCHGQVILWDTVTKNTLHMFGGIDFFIPSSPISFSPDGRHLAIIGQNVEVRGVNCGEVVAVCEVEEVEAASWSPNGKKLAVKCASVFNLQNVASVFNLQNVVEINLKVLSLLRVVNCLNTNIQNGDYEKEEVLEKLDIPKKIVSEVRKYLD